MPRNIPLPLFLSKIITHCASSLVVWMRFVLVCFVWLGCIPWATRWIWRGFFWLGDGGFLGLDAEASESSSFLHLTSSPRVNRLLVDCFQGQVITGALVLIFITVFLIREWVVQNAFGAVMDAVREVRENHVVAAALEDVAQEQENHHPLPPIIQPPLPQVQDDMQPNDEAIDDLAGVLEILGMRGSIITLFQHAFFSAAFIVGFIGLGIYMPYIWGRMSLFVLSNPMTFFVALPLDITRVATDMTIHLVVGILWASAYWITSICQAMGISVSLLGSAVDPQRLQELAYVRQSNIMGMLKTFQKSFEVYSTQPIKGEYSHTLSIAVGYALLTLLGGIYLSRRNPRRRSAERVFRDCLRQAGLVMKVITIISIELIAFPIVCGGLIDIFTFPIWKDITIQSRMSHISGHPLAISFLYWFVGTIYMFHFALFVGMAREIVRPGVLFMIRDPNDPNFHPIKDILDRGVITQLRKIAISAVMYSIFISSCFGFITYLIHFLTGNTILPLRMSNREPFFDFPIDILLVHVLLPLTFKFLKPSDLFRSAWTWWLQLAAYHLNLTGFFFGGRHPLQENERGQFVRAPANDNIIIGGRKRQTFISVNENNELLSGAPDETKDDANYVMVYLPPHFTLRIIGFALLVWFFSVLIGFTLSLGPCKEKICVYQQKC